MAVMLLIIPINLIIYAVLSFVLGFVRSDGSWRWGIIALIPNTGFTIYYFFLNVIADQLTSIYLIRLIVANTLYIITALLFAFIGSRLSQAFHKD